MNTILLTAVRQVVRADSDPLRRALFEALTKTSVIVRSICWLHKQLGRTKASSVLVSAYGLKSWLAMLKGPNTSPMLVSIAIHANARRRVAEVAAACGDGQISYVRTGGSELICSSNLRLLARLLLMPRSATKSFKLIDSINRR